MRGSKHGKLQHCRDVIRDCLEMAVLAPNSCNLQPWSFQVIRDPALLARLHPVCMSQNAAKAQGFTGITLA